MLCAAACGGSTPVGSPAPVTDEMDGSASVVFRPAPGRYTIQERIRRVQDFGGRVQPTEITRTAFLAVQSSIDGDSTVTIQVTVDSVVVDPRSRVPGTNLRTLYADARGLVFRAVHESASASLTFIGGDSTSQVSQEMAGLLPQLFPRFPGPEIRPHDIWTDTTQAENFATRVVLTVASVAEHRVSPWTIFQGVKALEIFTEATYDVQGSGSQAGQQVELDGQGVRTVRAYLDEGGGLLGSEASDSLTMTVRAVSAGITFPVVQTATIITSRER